MSYILDALKKSDQERQQGNSPHLHVIHGPIPQVSGSSGRLKQRQLFWLLCGCFVLFLCSIGLFLFQYYNFFSEKGSAQQVDVPSSASTGQPPLNTTIAQPSSQQTEAPPIHQELLIKEQDQTVQSITPEEQSPEPSPREAIELPLPSPPLLQDLSTAFQTEIPDLNFAGHIYAEVPRQRMIIINGKILREGDMIAGNLQLKEITWEGVIIQYKDTLFRINTN